MQLFKKLYTYMHAIVNSRSRGLQNFQRERLTLNKKGEFIDSCINSM